MMTTRCALFINFDKGKFLAEKFSFYFGGGGQILILGNLLEPGT